MSCSKITNIIKSINTRDLAWFLVKQNCNGCRNNEPSQKYHTECNCKNFISDCHIVAEEIISEYGTTDDNKEHVGTETQVSNKTTT
jgi:hypothetical protein